ncbi:hypothetical protein CGCSCA5_v009542 [Colletotrichum siamense]|nr:hypothetical protein CGCSCA5_v009542 [Colletotrichum siamense]
MLGDLRSFDLFDLMAGARNSLQRMEFTYMLCALRLTTFRDFMSRFSGARTALNGINEGSPGRYGTLFPRFEGLLDRTIRYSDNAWTMALLAKCRKRSIHCSTIGPKRTDEQSNW